MVISVHSPTCKTSSLDVPESFGRLGTVSVHAVFASPVTLDILDTCGLGGQLPFQQDGVDAAKSAHSIVRFELDRDGTLGTGDVRWPHKDSHLLLPLYQLIGMHIIRPDNHDSNPS